MDIQNKALENNKEEFRSKNPIEFDFIKDKPHLIFLIKKAEKICGVLHILTSDLSENEPLREVLRKECLSFLGDLLDRGRIGRGILLETRIAHIISLLDASKTSLLISSMNASVLKSELQGLLPVITSMYGRENQELIFDRSELKVSLNEPRLNSINNKEGSSSYKGHGGSMNVLHKKEKDTNFVKKMSLSNLLKRTKTGNSVDSTREKIILDVVRSKGESSIKDISSFVRGVSSKTIQRDLNVLIGKGVLKKDGERRWSKYSLT